MPLSSDPQDKARSDLLVMFGSSGDLAKKKLFPAIYRLECRGRLGIPVIGVARNNWTDSDLHEHCRASIAESGEDWDQAAFDRLISRMTYVCGDYNDATTFEKLRTAAGPAQHPIFHFAIPPSMFATVADGIASAGLSAGARLIIEKPFGRDLDSAVDLNTTLHEKFPESAIFRIDHFVGKEALRSLLVTRFANAIAEPLWTRNFVSSVKITMAESFGIEDRGNFYDSVGAMRDVVQNHLLQMVALLGMEQPVNEHSKALRDEKAKVLEACRVVEPTNYVRGQYDGYLDVEGVAPNSDTETFAAFRLDIDSPRWSGVPFFLRAGKALAETVTEMTIEFKSPPRPLWLGDHSHLPNNSIRIEAKPENFAAITWLHKEPGETMMPDVITLAPPPDERLDTGPEPYELLIEEAMKGDPTLFAREDSVLESWRIVERILSDHEPVERYAQGSWGPAGASRLTHSHGRWPSEPPAPAGHGR
jgi:glucose-6-phosphate 1-dehydrogenase